MEEKLYYRGVDIEELSRNELLEIVRGMSESNRSREKMDVKRQRFLLDRLARTG